MFERYTEKARRTIFFARYEASQFGCAQIETELLLLGLFREDKVLATRFLSSYSKLEGLRESIARHYATGAKILTSVDLPLTHECKRVLAYAHEESERLNDKNVDTGHLLLGMMREETSFAARFLREQGLTLELMREVIDGPERSSAREPDRSASIARFNQWLAEFDAGASVWTVRKERAEDGTTHLAFYAADVPKSEKDMSPGEKIAQVQQRIDLVMNAMERAIETHEFEKARFWAGEERKERENLRLLSEQYGVTPLERFPRLCIEIILVDLFSAIGKRCAEFVAGGVGEVWILDPKLKRAYTVTKSEGLREFKGEILRIASPPLEMDLGKIF